MLYSLQSGGNFRALGRHRHFWPAAFRMAAGDLTEVVHAPMVGNEGKRNPICTDSDIPEVRDGESES